MATAEQYLDESGLAQRLRIERQQRGWSTAELADRAGVSRAAISKIERGECSPTASVLGKLSAAFGITMSQFFARADASRGRLLKAEEQPLWRDPATGFSRRNLTPETGLPTSLELVWVELPKGASVDYPAAAYAFITDQQVVVLEGQLRLREGSETHELRRGDCLRLGPPVDRTFENRGSSCCRYVVAVLRSK